MAASVDVVQPRQASEPPDQAGTPIIVDLGRQRRKLVKRLRRGRGTLMDDVTRVIEELKNAGTIASSAQPVIIVIREKPKRMASALGLLR